MSSDIGKLLIIVGFILIVIGSVLVLTKGSIPLGKLPGDIRIEGKNGNFYFPLTTCLILSGIFTFIGYLIKTFKN